MSNAQGVEVVKGYVIIRNLKKGSTGFSDHRNSPVMLDAFGGKNDQIKILLEESMLDKAVRHYVTYRQAGLQVTFSDGINEQFPDFKSHLNVHSTAAIDQSLSDRINFIKEKTLKEKRQADSVNVRLARAKAQNIIGDNSTERTAMSNTSATPTEARDREDGAAKKRQPMVDAGDGKDGVELTQESLSEKEVPELIKIAGRLGVNLKEGVAKNTAIKAILLSLKN